MDGVAKGSFSIQTLKMHKLLSSIVVLLAVGVGYLIGTSPSGVLPAFVPENSIVKELPPWPIFRFGVALTDSLQHLVYALTPPDIRVRDMVTVWWRSEIVFILVKNGIIDATDGTTDCVSMAKQLDLQPDFVCRYMAAGEALGLLDGEGTVYSLTTMGSYLRRDHPRSLTDFTLHLTDQLFDAWYKAGTVGIKTGRSGYYESKGVELFDYLAENESEGKIFDGAMQDATKYAVATLLGDWAPPAKDATFCDIGGGVGTAISIIACHYPELKGKVFDMPSSIERAKAYIPTQVEHNPARIQTVGGDFFQSFPQELSECDVFHMKHILHDWGDEACITILKNILQVAKPGSTVIGHDFIVQPKAKGSMGVLQTLMDINMLSATPGGRERSAQEYFDLFKKAGYGNTPKLIKLRGISSLVEVVV